MTQDWQDCPTMKSVVEAMDRCDTIMRKLHSSAEWVYWYSDDGWSPGWKFRCRPAKKGKTVVMREIEVMQHNLKIRMFVSDLKYTGNEREEVPE